MSQSLMQDLRAPRMGRYRKMMLTSMAKKKKALRQAQQCYQGGCRVWQGSIITSGQDDA